MMTTYTYELVKMEPELTDSETVENILNDKGLEGFRFLAVQKLWTYDDCGESIQRNFLVLEKAANEEL